MNVEIEAARPTRPIDYSKGERAITSVSICSRNRNADEAAAAVGRVALGGADSGHVRPGITII